MLPNFTFVRAKSIIEAADQLSLDAGAVLCAGGTDLLGCLRDGVFDARKVVSIRKINALRGIRDTGNGGLRIGALTTIAELEANPAIKDRYRALAQGASEVASPQLRNQGTIGGNLCQKPRCWYYRGEFHCLRKGGDLCFAFAGENQYHCIFGGDGCYIVHPSDTAPALVALGATVRVAGRNGTRTIPLERFHVLPSQDVQRETVVEHGEVVTEILLPPPAQGLRSSYRKIRARRSWDFALAAVALAVKFVGDRVIEARVVLGGAAPVPWRYTEVEEIITGHSLDADTVAKAADAVGRNAQPLEQNKYKIPLFRALIEQELLAVKSA
jgi:xanthine dehydrogenase YagS FAD-binding subunit